MGGLRKLMPITFATYAIGMLALSGFPLVFSGFWSKDAILHAAHGWSVSRIPFYLGAFAAFLTAFYMTRQIVFVFYGSCRLSLGRTTASEQKSVEHAGVSAQERPHDELAAEPHESPGVMTGPLALLAIFAILLGFVGTPAWPWFQNFLTAGHEPANIGRLFEGEVIGLLVLSTVIVFAGIGLGWWLYARKPITAQFVDPLERLPADLFPLLRRKYFFDEIYEASFVRLNAWWARACALLDTWLWGGLVQLASLIVVGLSWLNSAVDNEVVNRGFDEGCEGISKGGWLASRLQDGRVQNYLRTIGVALAVLALLLIWGCRS
jgi:NADH-quinone oxidoreductase subunit L